MTDDNKNNPEHHGMNVSGLRRSATGFVLDREDLAESQIVQFEGWFRHACDTVPMDPNAVSIATVDSQNRPSSRTVLLKYFDEDGFVFRLYEGDPIRVGQQMGMGRVTSAAP